jgi:hypothetical protein
VSRTSRARGYEPRPQDATPRSAFRTVSGRRPSLSEEASLVLYIRNVVNNYLRYVAKISVHRNKSRRGGRDNSVSSAQRRIRCESSHPFHEAVHHTLFSGLVEREGELVAVDGDDVAVAEFLVKHALADREIGDGSG